MNIYLLDLQASVSVEKLIACSGVTDFAEILSAMGERYKHPNCDDAAKRREFMADVVQGMSINGKLFIEQMMAAISIADRKENSERR